MNVECILSVECYKMWVVFIIVYFSPGSLFMGDFKAQSTFPPLLASYIRLRKYGKMDQKRKRREKSLLSKPLTKLTELLNLAYLVEEVVS